MAKKERNFTTLPIYNKYSDKLELVQALLQIYSVTKHKLTNKEIDLLTLLLIYGLNNKEISRIAIDSKKFTTHAHVTTQFCRLKKAGVFIKHNTKNERIFSGGIEKIDELLKTGSKNISIQLFYEKK